MALNNYDSLRSSVANWLARADLEGSIPDFITLGQARLNRDLRVRQLQNLSAGTDAGGIIDLPEDLLEIQSLATDRGGAALEEVHPLSPDRLRGRALLNTCVGYVVIADNAYLIGGQGDQSYSILYRSKLPDITVSVNQGGVDTNWLLEQNPGAYLYAALIEASPYCGDDARTVGWAAFYKEIVDSLNQIDQRASYGNRPSIAGPSCAP